MTHAGFCRSCQQNVFLNDQWGCVNGHDWTQIEGWYDSDTGQPFTPDWVTQAPAVETPVAAVVPQVDPVDAMRAVLSDRLAGINLTVAEEDGVLAVSRAEEYRAAIAIKESGELVLWERLISGPDPGARDLVRAVAAEGGWRARIVLRRENVTG